MNVGVIDDQFYSRQGCLLMFVLQPSVEGFCDDNMKHHVWRLV